MKRYILLLGVMLSCSAFGQLQPGSIHPNAVVLTFKSDHPMLSNFSDGFAVLKDGDLFAVIDGKGRITMPYSKDHREISPFKNGYAVARNSLHKTTLIDPTGKIVAPPGSVFPNTTVDSEGYYRVDWLTLKSVRGETIKFPAPAQLDTFFYDFQFHDGLCRFGTPRSQGYVNRKGVVVIKRQFKDASDFSEGLAAVQRGNDTGEMKWGFIDKTGKTVIPYQFSSKPGDFHNGLSHVVNRSGQHVWIDKQGEVKIRLTKSYGDMSGDFEDGLITLQSYSGNDLLDTLGNIKPVALKFKAVKNGAVVDERAATNLRLGEIQDKQISIGCYLGSGLLDVNGNVIIPPVFHELSFFDPVSGLAKATYYTNNKDFVEGYINREGVFVIVKGKGSEW